MKIVIIPRKSHPQVRREKKKRRRIGYEIEIKNEQERKGSQYPPRQQGCHAA